jgi:hypothetical protein
VLYEIAHDLYFLDIVVRDFHASELVFNRYHQLNTVQKVGPKIVRKVRLACDRLNVNAELFGIDSEILVDEARYRHHASRIVARIFGLSGALDFGNAWTEQRTVDGFYSPLVAFCEHCPEIRLHCNGTPCVLYKDAPRCAKDPVQSHKQQTGDEAE